MNTAWTATYDPISIPQYVCGVFGAISTMSEGLNSQAIFTTTTTLPGARIMLATAPHGRQARPGEARICTLRCVSHTLCNAMERFGAFRSTLEGGNLPSLSDN